MMPQFVPLLAVLLGLSVAGSSEMILEGSGGCGKNCEYCNMTTDKCSQCGPGYAFNYASNGCEKVDSSVANCKYYSAKGKCSVCNDGFTLYGGGCESCPVNCQTCDSNPAKCDKCKEGWGSSDSTSKSCTQTCGVSNCHQCLDGSSVTCKTCKSGYRVTSSLACEKCAITNCTSCSTDVSKCDYSATLNSCNEGYFYLNDTCVGCETGCRLCDNDGQCLACNTSSGYYMWQDMQCFHAGKLAIAFWTLLLVWLVAA